MKIPKNKCKGCAARDEIIQQLARRIDELEKKEAREKRKIENELKSPIRQTAANY